MLALEVRCDLGCCYDRPRCFRVSEEPTQRPMRIALHFVDVLGDRRRLARTVRAAMVRLREHHSTLGDHLERSIRTGVFCAYVPDARVD